MVCPASLAPHLSATAFLRFQRSSGAGAISAPAVHTYLSRRAAMLQLWQHLAAFDGSARGTLGPDELRQAVAALVPRVPGLASLESHLPTPLYAAVATRKLLFFYGRGGGRVRISDLVVSPILAELLQLPPPTSAAAAALDGGDPLSAASHAGLAEAANGAAVAAQDDSGAGTAAACESWFAPATAARLVGLYRSLDADGGGLTPDDLITFSGGNLTRFFVARLFEEHAGAARVPTAAAATGSQPQPLPMAQSSSPSSATAAVTAAARGINSSPEPWPQARLGSDGFLDFLLAWEHRGSTSGLRYFWPALDLCGHGFLDREDVAALFSAVHALWLERGQYAELRVADVVEEVFDLAAPADPSCITAADLRRCGAGGDIVGILADVAAFWEHDSKEALLAAESAAASFDEVEAAEAGNDQVLLEHG